MEPIKIVLVDMPRMLREIVSQVVAAQPDMEIVRELEAPTRLTQAVDGIGAEFVIAGGDALTPDDVDALLETHPRMKVLAVAGDGRDAFLYELRPQRVPLGEVSPHTLLEAIRAASWARA